MITKFTIFGERNSGTNYLHSLLTEILNLQYTNEYGYKHWYIKNHYPRGKSNTTTDNECITDINNSDNTLFIFTVRNPYDWCAAMKKKPHHIKKKNNSSLLNFIQNKYIAYSTEPPPAHKKGPTKYTTNISNYYFIEEAKNLIELRNLKNTHFMNLQNKVKHFIIIRQEFLINDINEMVSKFNIKLKKNVKLYNYKSPTKYEIQQNVKNYINNNLNNEIDNKFYL